MPSVDVLIIAGQSNADGFPLMTSFPASAFTLFNRDQSSVFIYYKPTVYASSGYNFSAGSYTDDGAWWRLAPDHNSLKTCTSMTVGNIPSQGVPVESLRRCGIEVFLASLHQAAYPGRELRILKIGCHSSSLNDEWRPVGQDAGYLWDYFKNYIFDPAIADLVGQGKTPNIIGMVWMQGEGDANSTMAASYETNLSSLVSRVLALSHPPQKIVIGRLAAYYDTVANGQTVRAAQAAVATANAPVTALLDTDGFGTSGSPAIHYTPAGLSDYATAAWSLIDGGGS